MDLSDSVTDNLPHYQPSFDKKGYYEWEVTVARRPVVGRITLQDMHKFAAVDTSIVWDRFPRQIDVLTIHGLSDQVVPVYVVAFSSLSFLTFC